jgi:hypothetical protein
MDKEGNRGYRFYSDFAENSEIKENSHRMD